MPGYHNNFTLVVVMASHLYKLGKEPTRGNIPLLMCRKFASVYDVAAIEFLPGGSKLDDRASPPPPPPPHRCCRAGPIFLKAKRFNFAWARHKSFGGFLFFFLDRRQRCVFACRGWVVYSLFTLYTHIYICLCVYTYSLSLCLCAKSKIKHR